MRQKMKNKKTLVSQLINIYKLIYLKIFMYALRKIKVDWRLTSLV